MNYSNIFPIALIDLRKYYSFILDSCSNQMLFEYSVPKHMGIKYIHPYPYIHFFLVFKSRVFFA